MQRKIKRFADIDLLSRNAAEYIVEIANDCVTSKGSFSLVLSGGSTPKALYQLLCQAPYIDQLPWEKTHLFWGDERCVPPEHPQSNYGLAYKAFISKVLIPKENVHRIPVEVNSPRRAAYNYRQELQSFFQNRPAAFDLVLLGLGPDGHTASLFPDDDAIKESEKSYIDVFMKTAKPQVPRITITLPTLNRSKIVAFLVSGIEKIKILDSIITQKYDPNNPPPAALIKPQQELVWFVCEY
jgi:6-phosphogluconolactonase